MKAELSKTFRFEAGHRLPNVPAAHKCAREHGHSYRVTITVAGPVDEQAGWVMDFGRMAAAMEPLLRQLDHGNLNAVAGLANPTSEHIAQWIWDRIAGQLPGLAAVAVMESESTCCTYRGEQ